MLVATEKRIRVECISYSDVHVMDVGKRKSTIAAATLHGTPGVKWCL